MISHRLPILQEDERLKRLMKNLHHAYTGKNYVCNGSNKCVSVQSLDSVNIFYYIYYLNDIWLNSRKIFLYITFSFFIAFQNIISSMYETNVFCIKK